MLGVLFTIPLRRAMVVNSSLPYPEGVAAAEILRVGHEAQDPGEPGAPDIAFGAIASAVVSFASTGLHVMGEGISQWLTAGGGGVPAVDRWFSLALLGAGLSGGNRRGAGDVPRGGAVLGNCGAGADGDGAGAGRHVGCRICEQACGPMMCASWARG